MKVFLFISCWFVAANAFCQSLRAYWSTDSIEIGQQAILKIELRHAPKKVQYKAYSGEIPCEMKSNSSALTQDGSIEIIGSFEAVSFKKNGLSVWEGKYTLTAWDTGIYILPEIMIPAGDSVFSFRPGPLTVSFVRKKVNRDISEIPVEIETDPLWWLKDYWYLGLIPLTLLIVWLIRKRNSRPVARTLSLQERTRIGLEALRKEAYWKKNQIDTHYMEFSFLLRSFLSARYELNLMERTTYETLLLLRTKNIPEATIDRIRRLLQESDIVKFGMGIPDEDSILLGMNYFEQLIVELSPLELVQ